MEEQDREEMRKIIREELKKLRLDSLFEIFIREHNPLDGTHKENISEYVHYDDIQGTP